MALAKTGQSGPRVAASGAAPDGPDAVLFVATTPAGPIEAKALAHRERVTTIEPTQLPKFDGDRIAALVSSFGLPGPQAKAVTVLLTRWADQDGGLLAQVAERWAPAEHGKQIAGRLVLSGHSQGTLVIAENSRAFLAFNSLRALAKAMPLAAAQIEDLHLSGCYSLPRVSIAWWREAFPNLKTVWGYNGKAPSADTGSVKHLEHWAATTRGPVASLSRPQIVRGLVRPQPISVWSAESGFDDGLDSPSLADLKAAHRAVSAELEKKIRSPAVVEFGQLLKRTLDNPAVTKADREEWAPLYKAIESMADPGKNRQ